MHLKILIYFRTQFVDYYLQLVARILSAKEGLVTNQLCEYAADAPDVHRFAVTSALTQLPQEFDMNINNIQQTIKQINKIENNWSLKS